jgi:hypothetical protein
MNEKYSEAKLTFKVPWHDLEEELMLDVLVELQVTGVHVTIKNF